MNKYYGIAEAEPEIKIKRRTGQLSTVNVFSHGSQRIYPKLSDYGRALGKTKKNGKNDGENRDSFNDGR